MHISQTIFRIIIFYFVIRAHNFVSLQNNYIIQLLKNSITLNYNMSESFIMQQYTSLNLSKLY